jgi:hypothetical protein
MRHWRAGYTLLFMIAVAAAALFLLVLPQSAAPPAQGAAAPRPQTTAPARGQTTTPARGQAASAPQGAPRVSGRPDFSGIWQANNTANWDLQAHAARPMVGQPGFTANSVVLAAPVVGLGSIGWVPGGLGVVEGNDIPYLPWAAARKKENLENWMDRDPEIKCFQPGVPRAMYMPYPFQIIQSTSKVMMVFEYANAHRTIHLDKMEPYPNVSFMGYSVGRWEGDTLVVDSNNFTDATWFDRSGNFHSDALHVIERLTPQGADVIRYEATIEDPQVKKWTGATMSVDVTRTIPPGEAVHERYISGNPPAAK